MLFSSFTFLFLFFPFSVIVYFLLPKQCRNGFLLLISLIFYGWGEPLFLIAMAASILWNYGFGLLVARCRNRWLLTLGIAGNLGLLFYYKYLNFAADVISSILLKFGTEPLHVPQIVLPIGISFFTFQGLSYLIDVYRDPALKQPKLLHIALYIALFPQLIAGPIIRWAEIREEIEDRSTSLEDFVQGLRQFCYGLGAKVIIANSIDVIVTRTFDVPGEISTGAAWFGMIAYMLQIYYDFAGYSNMAIGIGRIFGFHFPVNFNDPFMADSFADFWKRWHISLSQWFRDYLYFPMGGSRKGNFRTAFNLLFVFTLTGFWHGANWTFILWGLCYGIGLVIERFFAREHCPRWLWRIVTLATVFLTGVIIRSDSVAHAWHFIGRLFGGSADGAASEIFTVRNWFFMICAVLLAFPWGKTVTERKYVGEIVSIGVLLLAIIMLARSSYNPFLYFRF